MNIDLLRDLPWGDLPPSAAVDFLQVVACRKPAVRLMIAPVRFRAVTDWSQRVGWHAAVDDEGFACVASSGALALDVLRFDRSERPHAVELGIALGYPRCCCAHIAELGEARIDEGAAETARWLESESRVLDVSRYVEGEALISHVPCASKCAESRELASRAGRFAVQYADEQWLQGPLRAVPAHDR